MSADMLRERLAALDCHINTKYVETGLLPGTLLQVWRHGEHAHNSMSGFIDAEHGIAMNEYAIFRIYSMTKPIIGVALLTLVEEGKISLTDEVSKYLPAWKDLHVFSGGGPDDFRTVPPRRPMTVLHLATHTAGLAGWSNTPITRLYVERKIGDLDTEGGLEAFVSQIAELPLEYAPGEGWDYSGATSVIGHIIERVSGERLGAFLQRRIFSPLGMNDTAFFCAPEKAGRLAARYGDGPGGKFGLSSDQHDWLAPPRLESGGGGLVSTAGDYMRFCRMLLGRGTLERVRILGPKSAELLQTNMLPGGRDSMDLADRAAYANWTFEGVGHSVCCGTTTSVARRGMPGTTGDIFWGGAGNTYALVDPAEDLAVVLMAQRVGTSFFFAMQREVFTMVYSALR